MTQSEISEIKELFSSRKKIVITTHRNPDGDAMGSSLGLYHFLLRKKHRVKVITPNSYPAFLHWLPGHEQVYVYSENPKECEARLKNAEIIFCLDFNTLKRTGDLSRLLKKSRATKILIDHHLQPEKFARYLFSNKKSSSSSELVYEFIEMLKETHLINKKSANCLYTGIMTDTLNFKIPTTTARTHRIVAELIDKGAQNHLAHTRVFDTFSEDRIRLLGHALNREMKVLNEFNTAFIALSKNDLKKYNFQKGDSEGLVNYPLSVEGIVFSALFLELKNEIKISFRSKRNFDVNRFARKHFSGGGHASAAGGEVHSTLDEAVSRFVNLLPAYQHLLLK